MAENEKEITIPAGTADLPAKLGIPEGAGKLVIFVHGTGSSRGKLPRRKGLRRPVHRRQPEVPPLKRDRGPLPGGLHRRIRLLSGRTAPAQRQ